MPANHYKAAPKPEVKQNIIWQPHAGQQTFALTRPETEILYGGARGGGKSAASIAWLTRWFMHPKLRFLVIRRNSGDLRDWIDRAKTIWAGFKPEFLLNEVRFPSGAIGVFGHLYDSDAYEKYQGAEFQKIVVEELTHIPEELNYLKLLGSCRSTTDGLKPQIFCTTNPGGPGHNWVKERFVSVAPANTTFFDPYKNSRIFVPATVEDNPTLIEKDPRYIQWLDSLPASLRKAWRNGSWDDFEVEGAYYANEISEAGQNGRIVDSFLMDWNKPVETVWDLGMNDSTAIWFVQRTNNDINFVDYFESEGEGLAFYADVLSKKKYEYRMHHFPHDVQVREIGSGKSRLEIAEELGISPILTTPKLSLHDGIQAVRQNFKRFRFERRTTEVGLNHLKMYRKERDEQRNVWKDKPRHDEHSHAADAMRYAAISFDAGIGTRKAGGFFTHEPDELTYELIPEFQQDPQSLFEPL